MNLDVTAFEDLTPEKIDEHMKDETWSQTLEKMIDDFLEDSDKISLERAYAITSMFIQTSYLGMLFGNLQETFSELYEHAQSLRNALAKFDLMNADLIAFDENVNSHLAMKNIDAQ